MSVITIDQDDNGKTIETQVGATIVLSLPENPTTGYRWQFDDSIMPSIVLQSDEYGSSSDTVAPGSGNLRILTFSALSEGKYILPLFLGRAWESADKAIEHFEVTLIVNE